MNDADRMASRPLVIAQPAEALRGYISAYFCFDYDGGEMLDDLSVPEWGAIRFVSRGAVSVEIAHDEILELAGPYINGPTSRAFRFSIRNCRMVGIGLLPAAFARFWNTDLSEIANRLVPLEHVLGPDSPPLSDQVDKAATASETFAALDRFFFDRLDRTRPTHQALLVMRMHKLLNDPELEGIEDIARGLKLAPSTVSNLCKRRFGFPPSLLLRRRRFLRMLAALHLRSYSDWPDYIDPQYADQSHMIREFKHFMGMSPGQYLALPRPLQQASADVRTAMIGSPLQGLE